jgi:uncharacterized protein
MLSPFWPRHTSVLSCKFIEEFVVWGGPPGPRPTPSSASASPVAVGPDQGSGADEGVRPTASYSAKFSLSTIPVMLKCPICKKEVSSDFPFFPFCSERCKIIDLGNWASEKYVVSTPVQPEDLESEDHE